MMAMRRFGTDALRSLLDVLPTEERMGHRRHFDAGIAGSVGLGILLSCLDEKKKQLPETLPAPVWLNRKVGYNPNDIDYYIVDCCLEVYKHVVVWCLGKLNDARIKWKIVGEYTNTYAVPNAELYTTDIEIEEFGINLSLHHHSAAKSMKDVINEYDLSVCKVIYYADENRLEYHDKDFKDIVNRQMTATYHVLLSFLPPGDVIRINKTLRRVEKYRKRGFKLVGDMMALGVPLPDDMMDNDFE